jgi:hypothetical protein
MDRCMIGGTGAYQFGIAAPLAAGLQHSSDSSLDMTHITLAHHHTERDSSLETIMALYTQQ